MLKNSDKKSTFLVIGNSPYVYLVKMVLYGVLLLSFSRLCLVLWNYERVDATGAFTEIILQGVRADLIVLCLWIALPLLLIPLALNSKLQKNWYKFTYFWCLTGLISLAFTELASPAFILQYDVRPNRLFVEYLKYPREVFATLWQGFRISLLSGLFLTILASLIFARLLKTPEDNKRVWPVQKSIFIWPIALFFAFAGVRSTSDHRPANPALFAITGDSLVNSLVISSGYSVLYSIYSMRHEANSSEMYGKLPIEEMLAHSLN